MAKPTIIIVPGAWHTPAHYLPLTSRLKAAGYKVLCPQLPSTGTDPDTPNHDQDVALIRSHIRAACEQADEDAVLVVHSAGGVTGSEAAKGFSKTGRGQGGKVGRVVHMVYMCAFAAEEGMSVFSATNGPSPWIDVQGPVFRPAEPEEVFYNDLSPAQAEEAVRELQLHSTSAMWSPATHTAWRHIPSTYLLCEVDRAIPVGAQEAMTRQEGATFQAVERCQAGHAPMVSCPDFVAEVVRRAAGEKIEEP